jgi:hypothetical protein
MKLTNIGKLFCGLLTASLVSTSIPVQAQSDANPSEQADSKVQFFCGKTFDTASNTYIPATLVWQPEKEGNIVLVGWKSEYFGKDNQKRCQVASAKFQKLWNSGQLNFVTTGTIKVKGKNISIICGVANEGDPCGSANQLFQVKPFADASSTVSQIEGIFGGKVSTPVYESGSSKPADPNAPKYIDVRGLLRNREVVSRTTPPRSR